MIERGVRGDKGDKRDKETITNSNEQSTINKHLTPHFGFIFIFSGNDFTPHFNKLLRAEFFQQLVRQGGDGWQN